MNLVELTKKIKYLAIYTNRKVNDNFSGNYKSFFRGQGLEVNDLRQYEFGDDARLIDWITSAKQGSLYIKKFQETRELTVMLLVDLSASMNFTTCERKKSDTAIEFIALILFSALRNNDKFGVVLFADSVLKYIPPKKGKSHLLKILREIILGFENNQYQKSNPYKAIDFLNNIIRKRSVCFFVGDEIMQNADCDRNISLKIANRKHDFVFVNIFDEFERVINTDEVIEIDDLESGRSMVLDFSDQKLRDNYQRLRNQKYDEVDSVLKKYRIEKMDISTKSNIYKDLLLFFKKRIVS